MVRVGDSIGFNFDKHRICVLLSRSISSLIIIGSMSSFQSNSMWNKLIQNAKDRRLFDTQKFNSKI